MKYSELLVVLGLLLIYSPKTFSYAVFNDKNSEKQTVYFLNKLSDWYYKEHLHIAFKKNPGFKKTITTLIEKKYCFGIKHNDSFLKSVALGFSVVNKKKQQLIEINDLCLKNFLSKKEFSAVEQTSYIKKLRFNPLIKILTIGFVFTIDNTLVKKNYSVIYEKTDRVYKEIFDVTDELVSQSFFLKESKPLAIQKNPFVISQFQSEVLIKTTEFVFDKINIYYPYQVQNEALESFGNKTILSVRARFNVDPGVVQFADSNNYKFYYP